MIYDRGHTAVGVDAAIFGGQMVARQHVHLEQPVRQPDLFEHDRDLVAVGSGREIDVDHRECFSAKMAREASKGASKEALPAGDRQSVVEGKNVSGRLDSGGGSIN